MTTPIQFRAVTERRSLDNTGLNVALVGSVDTGVLRWNVAALVNGGAVAGVAPAGTWPTNTGTTFFWADVVQTVGLGTRVKITRRGQWLATFSADVPASGGAAFGISYQTDDARFLSTPGLLAANTPINTAPGIRQGVIATAPVATVLPVTLTALISVSDRDAGDGESGMIRFHGTNDGAPSTVLEATDITAATARYTITYLGDLMGS